jgi:hypothetical protein
MSGEKLKACIAAFEQFSNSTERPDIRNFTVEVREASDSYEVIFVRNHPAGKPAVRGGRTALGKEVHYIVSKSTFKVTGTSYGR